MSKISIETGPAHDAAAFQDYRAVISAIVADPVDGQTVLAADPTMPDRTLSRIGIARVDGKLAGTVATYRDGDAGGLVGLGVLPPFRGIGLARSLVARAVADRDLIDLRPRRLLAYVRILPDGQLTLGSAKALEAAGFRKAGEVRPHLEAMDPRVAHLWRTAESDGTMRGQVFVRSVASVSEGC